MVRGDGPVVLGVPHAGTWLPEAVRERLNGRGRALADTDWHVDRLHEGLVPGATVVRTGVHRYVVDANRPATGESLYPGANTTGTVPLTDFDGRAIWVEEPSPGEIARRVEAHHAPYHAALGAELERVRGLHGRALLWDCHSIRSRVPFLFEGELPVLNVGTNGGRSCDPAVEAAVVGFVEASGFSWVANGRFRGGWTTRFHGRPGEGVHAVQMEIAQRAYLVAEEPPWDYDEARAERLRAMLAEAIGAAVAALPAGR